jgi:hypothetical protein
MGNYELRKLNKKGIIIFLVVLLFFAAVLIGLIQYDKDYNTFFKYPDLNNAEIDNENRDLENMYANIRLKGEWEFFYNKWIITDNYTGEADGQISVPEKWTGKDYGSGKLPREGYASYKIILKNVVIGQKILVYSKNYSNAYRTYINGQLCVANGIMSKDADGSFATVIPDTMILYEVEEVGELEVVMEISANREGGMNICPGIIPESHYLDEIVGNGWFGKVLPFVFLGLFFSIFILLLLLGIYYCFTIDVIEETLNVFSFINFKYYHIISYISGLLATVAFLYVLGKFKTIILNKKIFFTLILLNVFAGIMYFVFYGNYYMYCFLIVPVLTMLYYIYLLCNGVAERRKFTIPYLVMYIFLFMCFGLAVLDNTGVLPVGATSAYTIALLIMILSIFLISVVQIRDRTAQSQRAEQLEKEVSEVKNQALKAQIKPLFVFNMLTNIQDQYHKEIAAGDAALTKFSKHLRLNVDS